MNKLKFIAQIDGKIKAELIKTSISECKESRSAIEELCKKAGFDVSKNTEEIDNQIKELENEIPAKEKKEEPPQNDLEKIIINSADEKAKEKESKAEKPLDQDQKEVIEKEAIGELEQKVKEKKKEKKYCY